MSFPAKSQVQGPIGQTVLEVLGSLMSPELSEEVLRRTLERAGRKAVPENLLRVRELAECELREVVIELVGVEVAESVVRDLEPILDVVSSGVRPRVPSPTREVTPPPRRRLTTLPPRAFDPPTDLRVLVVTDASLEELKRQLGSLMEVARACDAFDLVTAIETRTGPLLVVVDGYRPAVDLSTLGLFVRRIPDGVRVALWGFTENERARFEARPGWSSVSAGPSWAALADSLTRLR